MSDLQNYFKARAEKESAYNLYSYASANLNLSQIKERLAEIKSQHEPLAGLLEKPMSERGRLYAAAFYVVVGRFPNETEVPE